MPPPVPFHRTSHLSLSRAGGRLIVRPSSQVDVFAWQRSLGSAGLQVLYLNEAKILRTSVQEIGARRHFVRIDGAFYAESNGEPPTERYVGPLPSDEARAVAAAIDGALSLPRQAIRVTLGDLERDPGAYDDALVELEASWETGLERSAVGSIWVRAPWTNWQHGPGAESVRHLVAFHRCSGGFGHFGLWRAMLEVVLMSPGPEVPHSDVTR